jgi:uncharacterized protein
MRNFFNSSLIFLVIIFSGCSAASIDPSLQSDIEKTYVFKGLTNDYERAMDAYRQHDYNRTFALLQPLAENNDTRAQLQIGHLYRYGWGIEKNNNKATYWYKRALELNQNIVKNNRFNFSSQNNDFVIEALNGIGEAYYYGAGVESDWGDARSWFMDAAEKGHPNGQYWVGWFYLHGTMGYPKISYMGLQSYQKAFYWFQKAAIQGHPEAQFQLGHLYAGNTGKKTDDITIDKEKAFFWWMKSAEQHHSQACFNVGKAYLKGDGVEQDFNQSAYWYQQAEKMGEYWAKGQAELIRKELISRENLAGKGDVRAQYELGMLFRYSRIPDSRSYEILRNDMKAKYWFKKAAEQGDENSLKEYNKL